MSDSHAEGRTLAPLQSHARRGRTCRVEAPHRHDTDASRESDDVRSRVPQEAPSRALSPGGSYGTSGRTSRGGAWGRPGRRSTTGAPPTGAAHLPDDRFGELIATLGLVLVVV